MYSAHHHTISCGVASVTRCRSVSRWRMQIQSPTATPGLSSAAAWSRYGCTTRCRPPQPLRVGEYLTLHSAAEHVSFRPGMIGATAGHTRNLHSINAHDVSDTFTSCHRVGNCRVTVIPVSQHVHCWS